MIFVTVGTSGFEPLIKEIDRLAASSLMKDHKVVCQIGNGVYLPENCEYFRYKNDISDFMNQADLIICHGGTGSTMAAIATQNPFIVVTNTSLADNHQEEFILALCEHAPIIWTDNPENLAELIQKQLDDKNKVELTLPCLYADLAEYIAS